MVDCKGELIAFIVSQLQRFKPASTGSTLFYLTPHYMSRYFSFVVHACGRKVICSAAQNWSRTRTNRAVYMMYSFINLRNLQARESHGECAATSSIERLPALHRYRLTCYRCCLGSIPA